MRFLQRALFLAPLALSMGAHAQFNGPAPLSWRWAQSTTNSPNGTPAVDGDSIFVSMGERFYGLDRQFGNQKWRFPVGIPNVGHFPTQPVLSEHVVVAVSDLHYAYGLDEETGATKWQHFLLKNTIGSPVAAGKYIVIALSDNTLVALDSQTGEEVWKEPHKLPDGITGSMASYLDSVIFFTSSSDMVCINIPTETQKWKTRFTLIDSKVKPVVAGETVYVNTGSFLAAVNVGSGHGMWQKDVGEQLVFEPAVSPTNIVVVTQNGSIMTFDRLGNKLFRTPIDLGTTPVATPTSVGDYFLIPSGNGSINLIDPRTGSSKWSFVMAPLDKVQKDTPETRDPSNQDGGNNGARVTQTQRGPVKYVNAAGPATLSGQTLLVLAKDGSLLAFDKDSGVDLTPPTVKMVEPNPGDQVSGQPPLNFAFTLHDDASGVNEKTVQISLDGKVVDFTKTKDQFYVVRVSTTGTVKPLSDGRHTLTVVVSDWMGNIATENFDVQIDNTLQPRKSNLPPTSGRPGGGNNNGPGSGGSGGGSGGGGGGGDVGGPAPRA